MKEYVLNYYPEFKCIANECKHTCCAGWDMYIDENTLNLYKNDSSDFAKTLNSDGVLCPSEYKKSIGEKYQNSNKYLFYFATSYNIYYVNFYILNKKMISSLY